MAVKRDGPGFATYPTGQGDLEVQKPAQPFGFLLRIPLGGEFVSLLHQPCQEGAEPRQGVKHTEDGRNPLRTTLKPWLKP